MIQLIKSIGTFILGALLVFLFMKNCSGNKSNDIKIESSDRTVVVKLTTKIDTIYVPKFIHTTDTIFKPKLIVVDTVFIDGTKQVAMISDIKRQYSDSVRRDSVTISYLAQTHGTLDNIVLDYKDYRAEKTIIRTNNIETTITNNIKPSGLYIGIGSNVGLNTLTPSLEYLNNKNKFGINYNLNGTQQGIQNLGITYSRKLF